MASGLYVLIFEAVGHSIFYLLLLLFLYTFFKNMGKLAVITLPL